MPQTDALGRQHHYQVPCGNAWLNSNPQKTSDHLKLAFFR